MQTSDTEALIAAIEERVEAAAINIRWKTGRSLGSIGERRSKSKGEGMEFLELDDYQPGDNVRLIHWPSTAKTGGRRPIKVVKQEERRIDCYVLANIDPSMNFGTIRCSKRMVAAEMTATIFYSVHKTRDRAGLIPYSRWGIEGDVILAGNVRKRIYPALTGILETEAVATTGKPAAGGLASALAELPPHRSLVFVVSDFLMMAERDWDELANAAVDHDIIAVYVQDLRERELPKVWWPGCAYELQDYDGNSVLIWNSPRKRRQYAEAFRLHEARVTAALTERQCQLVTVSTEQGDAAMPAIFTLFANH